jgi:hypothetical protein
MTEELFDISPRPGEEIVDTKNVSALRQQSLAKARTEEARTTCNQNSVLQMHHLRPHLFQFPDSSKSCLVDDIAEEGGRKKEEGRKKEGTSKEK